MKNPFPRLLRIASLSLVGFTCCLARPVAQTKSPDAFLGYEIGSRFTPHHRVAAYFEHVAATNGNVELVTYGTTYERRPLMVAFVSSPANAARLETIREDNLRRAGMEAGESTTRIPIIWLSYNVHGNEAVSCETAMKTLWGLVDPANATTKRWLENTVVAIDPCLNPDGQERYVNWYNQKMNLAMQPDPQSVEHNEPWPGGRPNHYLFDLNRDWAWQVQAESRARVAIYNRWMPQVHVDFHEQGVDDPYYFAPAAEPVHALVSSFQREFQETVGRNNARYFDEHAWLYFTREIFDLFYPSYGDSWPMFNGAIGMTYEQGGGGRAGLGIMTALGDTLTLAQRILHHYTSGMATIETVSSHADRLLAEYATYFRESSTVPKGQYKAYVIKAGVHPERMVALKRLLDRNGIRYGTARGGTALKGFEYASGKVVPFVLEAEDLVVSTFQPKSVLMQALFEPDPKLSDSLTYDITSWALPYAYGVRAYASETALEITGTHTDRPFEPNHVVGRPLAYIVPWTSVAHARLAAALLNAGIRVRYAERAFTLGGKTHPAGSLIIGRAGNEKHNDFWGQVVGLANEHRIRLDAVSTGYVDAGTDFGSGGVKTIKAPRVALIGGVGVSSLGVGEVWHFFEQDLGYPISVIEPGAVPSADLGQYNTIIVPSGNYAAWDDAIVRRLGEWVAAGGKLIALENAVGFLSGKPGFNVSAFLTEEEKQQAEKDKDAYAASTRLAAFQERERAEISKAVSGAIFEVKMDTSHPLGFGMAGGYHTLKTNARRYAYLDEGVNVGIIPDHTHHRAGFVGANARGQVAGSLVFGVEYKDRGQVIYLVDNPMFRGFWEHGKLVMSNALFMVN